VQQQSVGRAVRLAVMLVHALGFVQVWLTPGQVRIKSRLRLLRC
jgi:hypothetical protein